MEIQIGQIYRDTYGDRPERGVKRKRMIRIIGQEPDGRWITQTIVDGHGAPVANGRKTKVKSATLATGYELIQADPAA